MRPPRQAVPGDARPLGELMRELLHKKRFFEKRKYRRLLAAWEQAVDGYIAGHTRIASFSEGVVTIEVDGPALLQELSGFMKHALLPALQATDGGKDIAELRFRLSGRLGRRPEPKAPRRKTDYDARHGKETQADQQL